MMKRTSLTWVAAALMAAMTMVGCSTSDNNDVPDEPLSNEDNDLKDITLTRAEQELVQGNNDFAFNLFRQVASQKSEIVSPISITYALGMLNNGAVGQTQAEINKVLGFGEAGAQGINDFCRKMLTEAPALDKLTKVMIANTIFLNKNYRLKSDFVNKAKTYYDAEPETRDFYDGKTLDVINQWASDHTEKMIKKILDEDEFDPSYVSYLLNAIYFKGAWGEKFDKNNTKDETFKGYTAQTKVPMMHQEHEFNYSETDDFQTLCLPYGNGAYSMTILLPKEGKTIADVLSSLTAEKWQQQYWRMGSALVDVKLPRFESQSSINLTDVMTALGMPSAFDPNTADFSNFCDVPTFIGLMKQVAKIKLNEEGTEAAAVTVIGVKTTAFGPSEPVRVKFHANRPFLYVISEQSTGAIFFIGQYMGSKN